MVTAALVTPKVTPQAALLNGKVVAKNGQAVASANNKRLHPVTKDHIKVTPPKNAVITG